MNLQVDRTLIINGWNVGFRKVEFTKMLQSELNLGLFEAKSTTDRVLDKERVELHVSGQNYARIVELATDLGVVVLGNDIEVACQ
jgi:hypothetical protein